jgi:glycerol-3-phosphate acyltransferase PlsY
VLEATLFVVATYFWASVPSAYLVGRYVKGIDIRSYGSGNVGAANVMTHVGRLIGLSLGTFDCLGKGTVPVLMARLLDQSLAVQLGVGTAAIAGHNWSPFLRFTGGRGVATAVGVVVGFLMWPEALILTLVMGGLGFLLFSELATWTLVSMIVLPLLAYLFDRPPEVLYMTFVIAGLLMLKRLTANWESPSKDYPLIQVIAFRALWDRDVPRKVQWMRRQPPPTDGDSSRDVEDEVLR